MGVRHIQAPDLLKFIVVLGAHSALLLIICPKPRKIPPLAFLIRGNLYILCKIRTMETMQKMNFFLCNELYTGLHQVIH